MEVLANRTQLRRLNHQLISLVRALLASLSNKLSNNNSHNNKINPHLALVHSVNLNNSNNRHKDRCLRRRR